MECGIVAEEEDAHEDENEHDDAGRQKFGGEKTIAGRDPFDLESSVGSRFGGFTYSSRQAADWGTVMKLGFQCIGIVYGDLGTSPLYVLSSTFPEGIKHSDDILSVLSLIIYSLFSIALIKYVFVVLAANDNGDGGTFALYSLICRHSKASMIPSQQAEDGDVSNYKLELPNRRSKRALAIKSLLERSHAMKYFLLTVTMLGVSMLIGDGILTPCISVLSAVGGIKEAASSLTDTSVMWISVAVLIFLFQIQRFGTDKISYLFSPILILWFLFIAFIGIYNLVKYDPYVLKAFNPWHIVLYFKRNKKSAWISLGGVILCLTGSEALFADLGHFNIRSIQLSTCTVLMPSVFLAYFGQCSYLRRHASDVSDAFYSSIPRSLYWPQFILAILAAIIASQSLISATFSIVQQSVALGCFPHVKVVHTSAKHEGQVYAPEINMLLMLACVCVTLGFKNTLKIGNAYGIAVAFVFVITSLLLVLVMIMIWKIHFVFIVIYALTICLIELVFLSSVLYKFIDGGYLPLCFALLIVSVMFAWSYGYRIKYMYELHHKVMAEEIANRICDPRIKRLHGVGLFHSHLVHGVPPMFTHYLSGIPALHAVIVFVSVKSLPIGRVPPDERFLFQRVVARELVFRCVVRYGYRDVRTKQEPFETMLVSRLKEFVAECARDDAEAELRLVDDELRDGGVVCLMGEVDLMVSKGSSLVKKLAVNCFYCWLSGCVRQQDEVFLIPPKHLIKVGMTYEV